MNCGNTGTVGNFCSWVSALLHLIAPLINIASALAVVAFFYGLLRFVYAAGNSKSLARGKETIVWGLLALFVIFSLWGIISFFTSQLLPVPPATSLNYSGGALT